VRGEPGDLVPQTLRLNDGNLLRNALVGVKVERKTVVILLDDDPGGLLDGLGTNATYEGETPESVRRCETASSRVKSARQRMHSFG
jgi:hypothetical protein